MVQQSEYLHSLCCMLTCYVVCYQSQVVHVGFPDLSLLSFVLEHTAACGIFGDDTSHDQRGDRLVSMDSGLAKVKRLSELEFRVSRMYCRYGMAELVTDIQMSFLSLQSCKGEVRELVGVP